MGPDASTGGTAGLGGAGGAAGSGGAVCGNGMVDPGEECDDGNSVNGDGCDTNCRYSCTPDNADACSDHNFCNGPETCGDMHQCLPSKGNVADGTQCGEASRCMAGQCLPAAPVCGDGLIEMPTEECDTGTTMNSASCTNCRFTCVSTDPARNCPTDNPCQGNSMCDDLSHTCMHIAGTELSEMASCGTGKACVGGVCTDKYCGNGKVDPGEECDDGNPFKGDGCEPNCTFSCVPSDPTRNCQSTNTCIAPGTCDASTHKCSPLLPKTAGTACDTTKNCVEGNCITPICGDGIKGPGEACDDGGTGSNSCTTRCLPVCKAATDCTGKTAPPCRATACTGGACGTKADSTQNTNSCASGGAVCKDGACTAGTCGDGLLDAGEQCEDGNMIDGDGCDSDCLFSCSSDADCDDKNPCNGVETCAAVTNGKMCKSGTPLADGTDCAAGKICSSSICRASFCGDGYTDMKTGETCDPPNTLGCDANCHALSTCQISGNWGMKVSANVTWSGKGLVDGQGEIDQWALLKITQPPGDTAFTVSLKPCGLSIPDFHSAMSFGDETFGITFAASGWDSPKMPTFNFSGQLSNLSPGATFQTTTSAILIGLTIGPPATPTEQWPDPLDPMNLPSGYAIVDSDNDGNPGITATAKTGQIPGTPDMYKDIIWDLGNPALTNVSRANKLFVVVRQISSEKGTLESCLTISGNTTAAIDNHIVGCVASVNNTGKDCSPTLLDYARPIYKAVSATFVAQQIGSQDTCGAVRTAVP
jgi:cysteine-rich repeat protein